MTPETAQGDGQSRGRVLVVEDDAHIRDLVVLHLQLEGLTAVAAGDGTTGLRLAKADPFDLLILDVMLPQLDGVTATAGGRTLRVARGPFRIVANFSDAAARIPLSDPCEIVLCRPACKLLPGPAVHLPARGAAVLRTTGATVDA